MNMAEILFIASLNNEISPDIAKWAKHLIDNGQTVGQVKEAMQRMIDLCNRK